MATNGGRIDVLPNGHVLVPQMSQNKVIEYNAEGKPVWEATVEQPIAAVRLPNGHTLVTSLNQHRAVELDRGGRSSGTTIEYPRYPTCDVQIPLAVSRSQ